MGSIGEKWYKHNDDNADIWSLDIGLYSLSVFKESDVFTACIYSCHSQRKIFEQPKEKFKDLEAAKDFLQDRIKEIAYKDFQEITVTLHLLTV